MGEGSSFQEYRVLIVDDTPMIHKDYQTILAPKRRDNTADLEQAIFGEEKPKSSRPGVVPVRFIVDSAHQGRQALDMVQASLRSGLLYAMAFVDMRMPPGWDGIETISRIWQIYPDLEVTIATAYSDRSLDEIIDKLVRRERFLILKKPFDPIVVLQMAYSLTEKWQLRRSLLARVSEVQRSLSEGVQKLDGIESPGSGSSMASSDVMESLRSTRKLMQELTSKLSTDRDR